MPKSQIRANPAGHHANGFRITFESGWSVSVQWSEMNHCDNCDMNAPLKFQRWQESRLASGNAEIAIFNKRGQMVRLPNGDTVAGWITPDQLAHIMERLACGDYRAAKLMILPDWNKEDW